MAFTIDGNEHSDCILTIDLYKRFYDQRDEVIDLTVTNQKISLINELDWKWLVSIISIKVDILVNMYNRFLFLIPGCTYIIGMVALASTTCLPAYVKITWIMVFTLNGFSLCTQLCTGLVACFHYNFGIIIEYRSENSLAFVMIRVYYLQLWCISLVYITCSCFRTV